MKKLLFIIGILCTILSCQKENMDIEKEVLVSNQIEELQIKFAKLLAPALAENPELRSLIKNESLKQFDNDYDVLYQVIKDKNIGEKTVSEILASYAVSNEEFISIEEGLPLLTIFVPSLPNFSPEGWNTESEVPQVAVRLINCNKVPYYDASGKQSVVPEGLIPGFPLVIVKTNERVIVNQNTELKSSSNNERGNYSFSFVDESFDGENTKTNLKRVTLGRGIDAINIEAYNLGMAWHRDYVYYGLTPTNTTGFYRNNYSEFITSFKMLSDSWYGKISDQTGDPKVVPKKITPQISDPSWTDGFFEFKVEVLINATNGAGTTLTKYFPAKGSDLADITYKRMDIFWKVDKITAKSYNPNLELVPWDLKNYGMAWKFKISEVDPSEEYTYSEEISTTFATNFELSGTIKKIGAKFGASASTTNKSTCTRRISLNSDDLGETILTFDQPVITSVSNIYFFKKIYKTREVSTGWCSIAVEPKRIY